MSSFITPFVDQVVSSISCPTDAITELATVGVFLLSYLLWDRLSSAERRKKAARKLKANETGPCQGPKRLYSAPRSRAGERGGGAAEKLGDAAAGRGSKILEAQILAHLEQQQFTLALNLYRSARPEAGSHHFSEPFYLAFIESAVRVSKMDVAERLFSALKQSSLTPSVEFWRRILKMLSSRKHFSTCLSIHSSFKRQLPTDKEVLSCLANASLELGDAQAAAAVLEQYAKANLSIKDHVLFFRVYLALKDADSAEAVFQRLGIQATPLMLNLMLLTCVTTGQPGRALRLLQGAHNLEDEARLETDKAEGRAVLVDTVSYNTVIKGLAQAGMLASCMKCLHGLVSRGLQPDDITFATLLGACIEQKAMGLIAEMVEVCLEVKHNMGKIMYTQFIKALVKANCLPKALEVCEEMKKAGARPDVVTYSVLIKALVDQHDLEQALQLVEDMKSAGHVPDDIILTHLLEGCRYAGNHELGKKLFTEMLATGLKPSEFTLVTMLKLCGCTGAHQEAQDLVAGWEATHGQKPTVIHYTCLMSGCLRRRQYDLAWAAFEFMRSKGVKADSTTFSTLLPAMVAAQTWDRVLAIAEEALALPVQRKIPPETLNNALAQMQAASGYARQSARLRELMLAAGVSMAFRRPQPGAGSRGASNAQSSRLSARPEGGGQRAEGAGLHTSAAPWRRNQRGDALPI